MAKICEYLHDQGFEYSKAAILVVAYPLSALIDFHIQELKDHSISACSLIDLDILEDDVSKHPFVFTSLKLIVCKRKWQKMLCLNKDLSFMHGQLKFGLKFTVNLFPSGTTGSWRTFMMLFKHKSFSFLHLVIICAVSRIVVPHADLSIKKNKQIPEKPVW